MKNARPSQAKHKKSYPKKLEIFLNLPAVIADATKLKMLLIKQTKLPPPRQ